MPPIDTFRENSTKLIDEIVGPLNKLKLPFSSTHGVQYYEHSLLSCKADYLRFLA